MISVALLRSLEQSIVPTTKLLEGPKVIQLSDGICKSVNCYAYALGILYRVQIGEFIQFCPGFTANNTVNWQKDIMKYIEDDLNVLDIPHRLIPLDGNIRLRAGEYLTKVFMHKDRSDFHFVRYDPVTKKWFHKEGLYQPEIMRVYEEVEHSIFSKEPKSYHFGDYRPVGYFAIKEPSLLIKS